MYFSTIELHSLNNTWNRLVLTDRPLDGFRGFAGCSIARSNPTKQPVTQAKSTRLRRVICKWDWSWKFYKNLRLPGIRVYEKYTTYTQLYKYNTEISRDTRLRISDSIICLVLRVRNKLLNKSTTDVESRSQLTSLTKRSSSDILNRMFSRIWI